MTRCGKFLIFVEWNQEVCIEIFSCYHYDNSDIYDKSIICKFLDITPSDFYCWIIGPYNCSKVRDLWKNDPVFEKCVRYVMDLISCVIDYLKMQLKYPFNFVQ